MPFETTENRVTPPGRRFGRSGCIKRYDGGDMHLGVGIHSAGDGAPVFYDGHGRPFLS